MPAAWSLDVMPRVDRITSGRWSRRPARTIVSGSVQPPRPMTGRLAGRLAAQSSATPTVRAQRPGQRRPGRQRRPLGLGPIVLPSGLEQEGQEHAAGPSLGETARPLRRSIQLLLQVGDRRHRPGRPAPGTGIRPADPPVAEPRDRSGIDVGRQRLGPAARSGRHRSRRPDDPRRGPRRRRPGTRRT